jgi:2',3'-cyclic-nucleotide 2'-phosphodiesterase (5'-nucleotidase family)
MAAWIVAKAHAAAIMRASMSRREMPMRAPLPVSWLRGRELRWGAALALTLLLAVDAGAQEAGCLVILHNNDGESQLLNAGRGLEDFGGAARFAALVRQQREQAGGEGCAVLTLSSGDNFLPGPEFTASLENGVPFYDSLVISAIGYDALAIGNHEFDFGPEVLADLIEGTDDEVFLSANLDVSGEPELQALVEEGRIARRRVIDTPIGKIGVIGATTDRLSFISSPRKVEVGEVRPAIQAEVDALSADGIDKIVLISHLQSAEEDIELLKSLSGIDVAIAGGGDELLANPGDRLVPEDQEIYGSYPMAAKDGEGRDVPVITTSGSYKYLGRLNVRFDGEGNVVEAEGGPIRVAGGDQPDAVEPDAEIERLVAQPVRSFVGQLAKDVVGTSEVALDGRRSPGVRTGETNLGDLMADALLFEAGRLAPEFDARAPDVALQNAGGIRNDSVIPAGEITVLDTFDVAPFSNFVAVVENVPPEQFKEIMENAVAQVEQSDGRFAQIAGFSMVYDPEGAAQVLSEDGSVRTPGARVKELRLADGTVIVEDGAIAETARPLAVATINFLANGGDQYPFRGMPYATLGVSYQQALANLIKDGLDGVIQAANYPEGGAGRIRTSP